nr:E3 ubiquitin-protein ligase TRAIP-like isoform X2 [Nerophis lumbriciformis]
MPIRAVCTICADFFDPFKDVAAIHCGHIFHHDCLLQWFQAAPIKSCPQCRKQVSSRHVISRLFFNIPADEECSTDPEYLQNELGRLRVLLSSKEKDWRDKQKNVEALKDTVDKQGRDLDSLRKDVVDKEKLCSALRKQMTYLETQHNDTQAVKEEARRLRTKLKTYESLNVLLQGQRSEVESMITDMGVSHAAVEQLSIYCISLKKEYDNLKGSLKSSNDACERLRREVFTSNNKFQKASMAVNQAKEDKESLQKDLEGADKEISSLKKKVEFLQKSLTTPTRTNEALSRLVFESPAPIELKPHLHQPVDGEDVDLNMTFDLKTPDDVTKRPMKAPSKKMLSDHRLVYLEHFVTQVRKEDPFLRNSLLFRKKTFGSMLDPQRKLGAVKSGYDGLGGRTKFFQPVSFRYLLWQSLTLLNGKTPFLLAICSLTWPSYAVPIGRDPPTDES